MRNENGFTLIETMIVLTVAGIILAMGIPSFASYRNSLALRQATEMVQTDLERARQLAITRRASVYLRFGTPPSTATTGITHYWLHVDTNGNRAVDAGEIYRRTNLPSSTQLANVALAPMDTVAFDISGILVPGHTGGKIVVQNQRANRDSLMVSAAGIVYKP